MSLTTGSPMDPTGSDLLLNLDHVHRNRTNDEVKADGQRSGKCSVCLAGGMEHGKVVKAEQERVERW